MSAFYVIQLLRIPDGGWQGTVELRTDGTVSDKRAAFDPNLSADLAHLLCSTSLELRPLAYTQIMLSVSSDDLPARGMVSAAGEHDSNRTEEPLGPEIAAPLAALLRATIPLEAIS